MLELQPGLTTDELQQLDDESRDAMMLLSLTFESVGIMVHRRIVDIDIVWELMGGVLLTAWVRLRPWVFAFYFVKLNLVHFLQYVKIG